MNERRIDGLPFGTFQQVSESGYAGAPPACAPGCADTLVQAVACAVREARPVVTLPPHLFIPWRGDPIFVEARKIIDGSADGTVAAGASNAGDAEGIEILTQDDSNTFVELASYTVPSRRVAIIRSLAFETDRMGLYVDALVGAPPVSFLLELGGGQRTLLPVARLGTHGTLARPLRVAYVVPQDHRIALKARSNDAVSWHLAEAFFEGHLIQVRDVDETLESLTPEAYCR